MKNLSRVQIIAKLEKSYPAMNCMITEDFDGSKGGIWLSSEDGITDRKGFNLFDYYSESDRYEFGVIYHLKRWAERNGWYFENHDAGTIMIWPNF